ncbi:NlpC/P60 family protein [Terrisporobacter glycolicus]|uniref:SH3 domain-containing protein n=1 Tax=Terrisporobacter glycolicus ATCC 14880 = DSM 1288 TaxID=1121315 RepID=A0ABZ2EU12_9FIRM|nr:NlpC/P60 family protein [Terrisporobacter glycolicus]
MINKNVLSVATILVMSSSAATFVNGQEINIENKNITNKFGTVTPQSGLNVRKTPMVTNNNKLFAIPYNTKVEILGKQDGWYKIKINSRQGYVSGKYIETITSDNSTNVIYKYVSENRVNFRTGASTNSKVLQLLNKDEKVKFISSAGSWSKIEYNHKIGYIYSDYLSIKKTPPSTGSSDTNTSNSSKKKKIVSTANNQIGKPYVWGAQGPNSFDCSGLMTYIYKTAAGINLPRTSTQQSTFGTTISKSNLQEGDLIFSSTNGTGRVSHVGIYVGNGEMIHSPKPGDSVKKTSINNSYWKGVYLWSKRVL